MNSQPEQVPPTGKSRHLRTVVFVLLGLVALYGIYRYSLYSAVQRRLNAIHRDGFPSTCAELDRWYPQPPAGENAADFYQEAFAHYSAWTNSKSSWTKQSQLPLAGTTNLPPRTQPLPAEMKQVISEYLADNAEALRLLHQAATMKQCRFRVDLSKGYPKSPPHLSQLRQAERLLELETVQTVEEPKPDQAVESVIASLSVARSLNQEPLVISWLVRLACVGDSIDSMERVLNRAKLADDQLAKLAGAIEEGEDPRLLTRVFVGERCMQADIFQDVRSAGTTLRDMAVSMHVPQYLARVLAWLYKTSGLLDLDEKTYLDIMERRVEATRLTPPDSIAEAIAIRAQVKKLSKCHFLSRMMLGSLDVVFFRTSRYGAKLLDAKVALAIERYRIANGLLPRQLSDLVPAFLPAVPTDPFDGMPLRYKKLAKGYVVYSIGEDREDNDGAEMNSKGASYTGGTDITFIVRQ